MTSQGYEVDPEMLRHHIAAAIEEAGVAVHAGYASRATELAPRAGTGAGWRAVTALQAASSDWAAFVGDAHAALTALSQDVDRVGRRYAGVEQHAMDQFRTDGPR
jgi:hypothetical protein